MCFAPGPHTTRLLPRDRWSSLGSAVDRHPYVFLVHLMVAEAQGLTLFAFAHIRCTTFIRNTVSMHVVKRASLTNERTVGEYTSIYRSRTWQQSVSKRHDKRIIPRGKNGNALVTRCPVVGVVAVAAGNAESPVVHGTAFAHPDFPSIRSDCWQRNRSGSAASFDPHVRRATWVLSLLSTTVSRGPSNAKGTTSDALHPRP